MSKVLVVATSRKTRGGITSVVKAHETGPQWKKYHCRWIQTHRDGPVWRKIWYFITALLEYVILLPWYDIVHIHAAAGSSAKRKLYFAKLAQLLRKKIIVHFHPSSEKTLFGQSGAQAKKLFDMADLICVLAPRWESIICDVFKGNNYQFEVVYNPCPHVPKRLHSCDVKEKYILYAGRLSERKGYNRLLEAFAQIAKRYPDWKLIFAGDGEIENAIQLRGSLKIDEKQVVFLGWISGKEKDDVFQNASIYCLPSMGEGFPMGVLDAVAYGVPVITTPVGGIMDVMHNGVDCCIFDTYDIETLASCLSELMNSEDKRKSLVHEADKLKDNEFNLSRICKQLEDIYSSI